MSFYPFYVLTLLALITLVSYYDRFLIGILVQDIKAELHASDASIGLLSGLAFALIYSTLAIPIATWSDRGRRVSTLTISLIVWSTMTALCGFAGNFGALMLARLGVAVGEAGGVPTIHALVSEHFSARWRGTALSVIVVVSGFGFMAATGIGGWVAGHWGWRAAFWVGAAPGPVLALLLCATVRSHAHPSPAKREQPVPGLVYDLKLLARRRSFILLCFGMGVCSAASYASLAWTPAILMREFGLNTAQIGTAFGAMTGIGTIAGLSIGGVLGDVLGRVNTRWRLWVPASGYLFAFPVTLLFLYSGSFDKALSWAAPMMLLAALGTGPTYALVQALAGPKARATAAAVYLLIVNLIGMGIGPSATGLISDMLRLHSGSMSLRDALALISISYIVGAGALAVASKSLIPDIAEADRI